MSMEMDHSFTVPVPPARAWDVLLDVERIAPCIPGATVDEFDGEVVTGQIKVKVGPVSLTYRGTAKFIERDPAAQVVVVEASGRETRGAGTASATVRAALEPESSGEATKVRMHTTMNITGRPAQFGRGVMVVVGGNLVEEFAKNLAQQLTPETEADTGRSGPQPPESLPPKRNAPVRNQGFFRRRRGEVKEARTKQETDEQLMREAHTAAASVAEARATRETQVQASQLRRPKIFLCYRREDTQGFARGIYQSLSGKYGHEQVFRDIDSTPAGVRFSTWIESRVGQ